MELETPVEDYVDPTEGSVHALCKSIESIQLKIFRSDCPKEDKKKAYIGLLKYATSLEIMAETNGLLERREPEKLKPKRKYDTESRNASCKMYEGITIKTLVENNILKVGDTLTVKYFSKEAVTTIDADGCIGTKGTPGYGTRPTPWVEYEVCRDISSMFFF